jgi:hypothetical protein
VLDKKYAKHFEVLFFFLYRWEQQVATRADVNIVSFTVIVPYNEHFYDEFTYCEVLIILT